MAAGFMAGVTEALVIVTPFEVRIAAATVPHPLAKANRSWLHVCPQNCHLSAETDAAADAEPGSTSPAGGEDSLAAAEGHVEGQALV